jgi:hypothetical protein
MINLAYQFVELPNGVKDPLIEILIVRSIHGILLI